ncbi:MAG: dTMP kinase [Candidatus Kryptoniota bacterium]
MLIAFEGIDGSGKTTQAELLSRRLANENIPNEILREPGGTPLGEGVRELLLHRTDLKINPVTEFFLFSASRAQLVREKIIPILESGKVVILDRYFYSSIAYQGFGRGIPVQQIEMVSHLATKALIPDVIFLVELDTKTALKRRLLARRSADRMEDAEVKFFEKVSEGFTYCAKKEPDRFVIVNGNGSVNDMADKIFFEVMRKIKKSAEERDAS